MPPGLSRASAIGATYPNASNTGATLPGSLFTVPSSGTTHATDSGPQAASSLNAGWTYNGTTWTFSGTPVLSALSIAAELDINASNTLVTGCALARIVGANTGSVSGTIIDNCTIIRSRTGDGEGIKLSGGPSNIPTDTTIRYCTIAGLDTGANSLAYGIDDNYANLAGVNIPGGLLVFRCNIYNCRSSIQIASGVVESCYIHDPGMISGEHVDCFLTQGGANAAGPLILRRNTMVNNLTQTAAILLASSVEPAAYMTVDGNLLAGGSYPVYGGNTTDSAIRTDNGDGTAPSSATFTATYSTAGSFTFVAPAGVTSLNVSCWGAAGSGGGTTNATANQGGGGGGGGEFAQETALAVTPGNPYPLVVPPATSSAANGNGTAGASATFAGNSVTVTAHGGQAGTQAGTGGGGGAGGTGYTSGTGTHHNGGAGAAGSNGGGGYSGGGGGSAGPSSAGNSASGITGGTAVTGGGAGANGLNGSTPAVGAAGTAPGGGGSGAWSGTGTAEKGGGGAAGQVVVTWTMSSPATFTAPTSGVWQITAPGSSIKAECWGAGGAGGSSVAPSGSNGGGGGGGEYAAEATLAVTNGNLYTFAVGAGGPTPLPGANGAAGTASTAAGDSATVTAHGGGGGSESTAGAGAAGSAGTGSLNTTHHDGGAGAAGVHNSASGGSGSSAGPSSAGFAGSGTTGGSAVTGGGPGANGATTQAAGSKPASGPGGGGSGSYSTGTAASGGAGWDGQVTFTWTGAGGSLTVTDSAAAVSSADIGATITSTTAGIFAANTHITGVAGSTYTLSQATTGSGTGLDFDIQHPYGTRTDPGCTISGGTTLTDSSLVASDAGAVVTGTGIPAGTTIAAPSGTTATLSQSCTNGSGLTVTMHYTNNIVVTNNRISAMYFPNGGNSGLVTDFDQYGLGNVWTNNVVHETGAQIPS